MTYTESRLQARWYTETTGGRTIRLLVLHVMVAPEKDGTAETVAQLFRTWDRRASAHECIDNNSVVVCVDDDDVAWAASGANHDGKHYELAGYTTQSSSEWLDEYGIAMLDIAARRVARDALRYGIPIVRLTVAQVRDGITKGICDHAAVEAAFPSTGHTDVGPNFPWGYFMDLVGFYYRQADGTNREDDTMPDIPSDVQRLANGRWPRLDCVDKTSTSCTILASPGIALLPGLDKIAAPKFTYGPKRGSDSTLLVSGLTSPPRAVVQTPGAKHVLVCLDGSTFDVAG